MLIPILAVVVMLIVSTALVFEVRAWNRGTRLVTQRQKLYRILAAVMMNAVLMAAILGPTVQERNSPFFEVGYWGVTMMISFLVVFVAMLDVRAGLVNYRNTRREAFRGAFGEERPEE